MAASLTAGARWLDTGFPHRQVWQSIYGRISALHAGVRRSAAKSAAGRRDAPARGNYMGDMDARTAAADAVYLESVTTASRLVPGMSDRLLSCSPLGSMRDDRRSYTCGNYVVCPACRYRRQLSVIASLGDVADRNSDLFIRQIRMPGSQSELPAGLDRLTAETTTASRCVDGEGVRLILPVRHGGIWWLVASIVVMTRGNNPRRRMLLQSKSDVMTSGWRRVGPSSRGLLVATMTEIMRYPVDILGSNAVTALASASAMPGSVRLRYLNINEEDIVYAADWSCYSWRLASETTDMDRAIRAVRRCLRIPAAANGVCGQ